MTAGQFMRVSAIHAIGNSLLNLTFETNDRFNMSRPREHIKRRHLRGRVFLPQGGKVPCLGGGIAGDVDDLLGGDGFEGVDGFVGQALAGRVHDDRRGLLRKG